MITKNFTGYIFSSIASTRRIFFTNFELSFMLFPVNSKKLVITIYTSECQNLWKWRSQFLCFRCEMPYFVTVTMVLGLCTCVYAMRGGGGGEIIWPLRHYKLLQTYCYFPKCVARCSLMIALYQLVTGCYNSQALGGHSLVYIRIIIETACSSRLSLQ